MKRALTLLAVSALLPVALPSAAQAAPDHPKSVVVNTNLGTMVWELDRRRAPLTVANFLAYTKERHYDGTIFHRVIKDFVVQGGGHTPDMTEKPARRTVRSEADNGLKNTRLSLAMAREAHPDSAGAQFYLNTVDNPRLDYPKPDGHGYTVFGRVVHGAEVVDRIARVSTETRGEYQNVPVKSVVIRFIRVI